MYGPVNKRRTAGPRGEAVSLLAELRAAQRKAGNTYGLEITEFLPADFWVRLDTVLEEESHNIKEIK